jgi:repressor LexA
MNRLTKQQQTVYDFIREGMIARGYGPTVREIGEHMGIRSPNGVMCHLRALEKKGFIVRSANKSRAIELAEPLLRGDMALDISGMIHAGIVQLNPITQSQLKIRDCFKADEQFLLTVRDDHLLALNIKAGDQLLVSKQGSPAAGQLVVALNSESGATVIGQVQIESGRPRVTPLANSPLPASSQTPMNLLGVVVGVLRFF